jgi:hypothetical protein
MSKKSKMTKWCKHMTHAGNGFVLLGEKPRIPWQPRWSFCPLCGKHRPLSKTLDLKEAQ